MFVKYYFQSFRQCAVHMKTSRMSGIKFVKDHIGNTFLRPVKDDNAMYF